MTMPTVLTDKQTDDITYVLKRMRTEIEQLRAENRDLISHLNIEREKSVEILRGLLEIAAS